MITNPQHVSEGRVRFTLKDGSKIEAVVRFNNPVDRADARPNWRRSS